MSSAPLVSSLETSTVFAAAPAIVKVKNLQSNIQGPHDAWGRHGRPQPISISATVSFSDPFESSSTKDKLSNDTVHYGLLAKAIMATLNRLASDIKDRQLRDVLDAIWIDLTGFDTFGIQTGVSGGEPFLNVSLIQALQVSVHLPKASLLGAGVSLTSTAQFEYAGHGMMTTNSRSLSLKVHELRVPTLIGVNPNEREAKQVVITNVEIDRLDDASDKFCSLEAMVVKELSDSSFETLEALGMLLIKSITQHLKSQHEVPEGNDGWYIGISLEKPIAIPAADASCVELRMKTGDLSG